MFLIIPKELKKNFGIWKFQKKNFEGILEEKSLKKYVQKYQKIFFNFIIFSKLYTVIFRKLKKG